MEENSECRHCRTWQEEIYWNRFTSIHFSLTLPFDFHDHLKLPVKFSAHMKAQVPNKVSLKGPSGALWDIELSKSDDLIFVGDEWKNFVKTNGLKENCLLVFKYERNLGFKVLIFDHGSSCEKESTYFVKNCKHTKSGQDDQKKMVVSDVPSTEIIEDDGEEETSFVASKKLKKDDEAEVCLGKEENAATPRKGVPSAASKQGGRPIKLRAHSTKRTNINEKAKKVCHTLRRNRITLGNEKSYLKRDGFHKSEALTKKRLNGNVEAKACSNEKKDCPRKDANSAASKHLGKPRKRKAQSTTKSIIQKKDKEVITSQRDVTRDNGESYREKDDSQKSGAQSKDSLNESDLITPENAEISPASNESQGLKGQSEKQPRWDVITSESRQFSEMNLIPVEDGERFRVINYPHNLETLPEKGPTTRIDTSKEPHPITPENREDTPLMCYSSRTKGQAKNKSSERGIGKMGRLDCSGSFARDYHSSKSHGKSNTGKPKKQLLPKSSKKIVSKSASEKKSSYARIISNRRPVTEKEKANALLRANEKQTKDSFTAVMRPSCVYSKFFLNIPADWLRKHSLQANQEVILRVGDKTWLTRYRSYGINYQGIVAGWKKFVQDNQLEESDVLVFKPSSQKDDGPFVMDVDIFRVV